MKLNVERRELSVMRIRARYSNRQILVGKYGFEERGSTQC